MLVYLRRLHPYGQKIHLRRFPAQPPIVSGGEFQPSQRELSQYLKYMTRTRISEFESYHPSQAVRSLRCDFRVRENRRHSGGLGWRARVSVPQFSDFRSRTGGFRAPVSARHFPISVSACRRPVRYVTETGSQSRIAGAERDTVRGLGRRSLQEPNALLLLGPRIRQRFGEAGDREIRRRGAIDDRRNDAW